MVFSNWTIHSLITFMHLIYPSQFEIKNNIDIRIQLHKLRSKLCDKRNDFNFPNTIVSFKCSNINPCIKADNIDTLESVFTIQNLYIGALLLTNKVIQHTFLIMCSMKMLWSLSWIKYIKSNMREDLFLCHSFITNLLLGS